MVLMAKQMREIAALPQLATFTYVPPIDPNEL